MMNLQAMVDSFERARTTASPDQVAEFERQEQASKVRARLSRSNIPAAFRGANIEAVPEAVKAYARQIYAGRCQNLMLCGQVGRGKTYAACAVLIACAPKVRGVQFVTAQDIAEHARSWDGASWLDVCRGVDLLVIDDLGNEETGVKPIAAIKNILDIRNNRKPTIITTQFTRSMRPEQFGERYGTETAKALLSRLNMFQEITLTGEDRRHA